MSVKRYNFARDTLLGHHEIPPGEWVRYEDYAGLELLRLATTGALELRAVEVDRLKARIASLEAALRSLRNETHGALYAYEPEIRGVIGNTNFQCIERRLDQADKLLSSSAETPVEPLPPRICLA